MRKRSIPAPFYTIWIGFLAGLISSSLMALPVQSVQTGTMDADYWLIKLLENRLVPYSGELFYFSETGIKTVAMTHGVLDGEEIEHVAPLNGAASEVIRVGDRIFCLGNRGSEEKDVQYFVRPSSLPQKDPLAAFTLGKENADRSHAHIVQHYSLTAGSGMRVAGRDVILLELNSKDGDRYSRHFWMEPNSGLLLKSATLSESGRVLESMEFVSVEFGHDEINAKLHAAKSQLADIPPMNASMATAALSSSPKTKQSELTVSWLPSGFKTGTLSMELYDSKTAISKGTNYSDGLSNFTLFIEPVESSNAPVEVLQRRGATLSYSRIRASNNHRITLVGELPETTAQRIVNSIQ